MPTIVELKKQAKAKGIKGYSKMRKGELEAHLSIKPRRTAPVPPTRTTSIPYHGISKLPPEIREMIIRRIPDLKGKHAVCNSTKDMREFCKKRRILDSSKIMAPKVTNITVSCYRNESIPIKQTKSQYSKMKFFKIYSANGDRKKAMFKKKSQAKSLDFIINMVMKNFNKNYIGMFDTNAWSRPSPKSYIVLIRERKKNGELWVGRKGYFFNPKWKNPYKVEFDFYHHGAVAVDLWAHINDDWFCRIEWDIKIPDTDIIPA